MLYQGQGLIHLYRVETSGSKPFFPLLLLVLLHGLLDADLCPATDTLFKGLQLIIKGILILLICRLTKHTPRVSEEFLNIHLTGFFNNCSYTHSDLYLGEELTETASWIDLQAFRKFQDELHNNGLMGHLFHESMFLKHTHTPD